MSFTGPPESIQVNLCTQVRGALYSGVFICGLLCSLEIILQHYTHNESFIPLFYTRLHSLNRLA